MQLNCASDLTPRLKSNFLLKCTNRPNNARQRISNFDKHHLYHFPTLSSQDIYLLSEGPDSAQKTLLCWCFVTLGNILILLFKLIKLGLVNIFCQSFWSQYKLQEFWLKKFKWFCSMGQFVSSISKTNIHPGQLSQRELLSSYLGNESPKTAFAFSAKSHKQIEGKQREMSKSQ